MANIKDSPEIEAVHNEWCKENGYPVRKRKVRKPGRPQVHKPASAQANKLNADNSERFVKGARSQADKPASDQASSGSQINKR